MEAPLKSIEISSDYSVNHSVQDGPDAFTDLEQLEQAKKAYNQAKQVRYFLQSLCIFMPNSCSDLIWLQLQRNFWELSTCFAS